mgnify:CR=1 FL=1
MQKEIEELELKAAQEEFWNDIENSQKVLQRTAMLKGKVEKYNKLCEDYEDTMTLIELADFYDVDIREIIDGERKSEHMDNEIKDTLKKVAEYATEENNKRKERLRTLLAGSTCLMLVSYLLFGSEHKGRLNGIIPESICCDIMSFVIGLAIAALALYALHCLGTFDKIGQWKKNRREKEH